MGSFCLIKVKNDSYGDFLYIALKNCIRHQRSTKISMEPLSTSSTDINNNRKQKPAKLWSLTDKCLALIKDIVPLF